MELSDVEKKMLKENMMMLTGEQAEFYTSGMICWGKFIEDFKFYLSSCNHLSDLCECETNRARRTCFHLQNTHYHHGKIFIYDKFDGTVYANAVVAFVIGQIN